MNENHTGISREHLHRLVKSHDMPKSESAVLARLMELFSSLGPPPDPHGLFANYVPLQNRFRNAALGEDGDALEETFLELYCHIHGHEAPYTAEERQHVTKTGGYWCHAGGLSPILKAASHITPATVSADYGAGNGLQGLLLQKLYPHTQTIQIEISSRMVETGVELQKWLEIPKDRVQWITGDVNDIFSNDINFFYIYRPVRPEGYGIGFYENFARRLSASPQKNLLIFSIADCLRDFLPAKFEIFYSDGHLTCFRRSS